jgi:hypothetical protein
MDRNPFSFMMLLSYFQTTTRRMGFLRLKSECKMTMIYGNCMIQSIIFYVAPVSMPAAIQHPITTPYNAGFKQNSYLLATLSNLYASKINLFQG